MPRLLLALAALSGLTAVALGAFGAHALKTSLTPAALSLWQTAVQYQFSHTLALLACGLWALLRPARLVTVAGSLLAAGIVLFSGSLYALALTEIRALGIITPIGGSLWLIGWLCLLVAALRLESPHA